MPAVTLNISLNEEQAALIGREVDSGLYSSASEVVREALRQWSERRMEADVAALEKATGKMHARDITPTEEDAILRVQKRVRAEMLAERKAPTDRPKKGRDR